MFPGHLLVRVPQIEPDLGLALFDIDWLKKSLEESPIALAYRREGDGLLVTTGTRDLQKFVLHHLGPDALFEKPEVMIRRVSAASSATRPDP